MTDDGDRMVSVTVEEADDAQRLDIVLARRVPDLSRARVQHLIRQGHVRVEGRTIGEPRARVKPGNRIEVDIPPARDPEPAAEALPLCIVYEDDQVIVLDKPAGVVVHPAAGHESGTLVNALIAHCGDSLSGIGGVRRPGIVHRLDKDTSGLLVVAKTDAAHRGLSEQFAAHGCDGRLVRSYIGVCWRAPDRPRGTIDAPLARSTHNRTKIAIRASENAAGARRAVTHYEVLEVFAGGDTGGRAAAGDVRRRTSGVQAMRTPGAAPPIAALVRLDLETGRTHQIRVHLAHIGHPLLGDRVYGAGFRASASVLSEVQAQTLAALGRQALHAAVLGFEHPLTGERLVFESPLPEDMQRLVNALRLGHP